MLVFDIGLRLLVELKEGCWVLAEVYTQSAILVLSAIGLKKKKTDSDE